VAEFAAELEGVPREVRENGSFSASSGNHAREHIRLQIDEEPNQRGERHAVEEDVEYRKDGRAVEGWSAGAEEGR
jgi:hypothetical protein